MHVCMYLNNKLYFHLLADKLYLNVKFVIFFFVKTNFIILFYCTKTTVSVFKCC